MIRYLIFVLFNLIVCSAYSQNRNSIWCFGDSAGIDFRNPNNPLPIVTSMDGRGSCVSICDSLGNLQFYANTYSGRDQTFVWNSLNDTMVNAEDSLLGEGYYNELQIVPFPSGDNKYYIFNLGISSYYDGIYYFVIDMNQDQGLGAVVGEKINHVYFNRIADCLQAVKHANGRDWWLLSKYANTSGTHHNRFVNILISGDSIYSPMETDFNDATDVDFQKIIFNKSATKVMLISALGFMAEYDFDRCTGNINNENIIFPEQTTGPNNRILWEGCYSSNDSLFYLSTNIWTSIDSTFLIQYNLFSSDIPASADTIDIGRHPAGPGAVRLAPDGKVYYSRAYENPSILSFPYADTMYNYINMNLSVVNNPNVIGSGCNYQPFNFYLGGKRTYYGLPNNPDYDLGPVIGSICDSLTNGIKSIAFEGESFSVYPNPFQNRITIHSDHGGEILIYDQCGKIILTRENSSGELELDLSGIAAGVYTLEVDSNTERASKKLVKLTN